MQPPCTFLLCVFWGRLHVFEFSCSNPCTKSFCVFTCCCLLPLLRHSRPHDYTMYLVCVGVYTFAYSSHVVRCPGPWVLSSGQLLPLWALCSCQHADQYCADLRLPHCDCSPTAHTMRQSLVLGLVSASAVFLSGDALRKRGVSLTLA
jgi:hypothetical protein